MNNNSIRIFSRFENTGCFTDEKGNPHYFYITPVDYGKKYLLKVDHAGIWNHQKTIAHIAVYKTQPSEVQVLIYSPVPNYILEEIVKLAVASSKTSA